MQRTITSVKNQEKSGFALSEHFNLSESYISLLLGILVVLVVAGFLFAFIKNRRIEPITPVKPEIISQEIQKAKQIDQAQYTVVEGDTLWDIAEKKYNSGFVWNEIAKENNIATPEALSIGTKLTLSTTSKILAADTIAESTLAPPSVPSSSQAIEGMSYEVKRGDDLWDIAIRAYGDGYRWEDIAKANNLTNPEIIHSGNILTIPR